jgi:hypothetical protein
VVHADRVAIDGILVRGLGLAQPQRAVQVGPAQIMDRLAALALLLDGADLAQRRQKSAVEAKAPFEVGDDQVDVIDQRHRANVTARLIASPSGRGELRPPTASRGSERPLRSERPCRR